MIISNPTSLKQQLQYYHRRYISHTPTERSVRAKLGYKNPNMTPVKAWIHCYSAKYNVIRETWLNKYKTQYTHHNFNDRKSISKWCSVVLQHRLRSLALPRTGIWIHYSRAVQTRSWRAGVLQSFRHRFAFDIGGDIFFPTMEVNGAPKQPGYKLSSKYLPLCSAEQRNSYRFGTTSGRVNDDRIFIFGWTIPLIAHHFILILIELDPGWFWKNTLLLL